MTKNFFMVLLEVGFCGWGICIRTQERGKFFVFSGISFSLCISQLELKEV